MSYQSSPFALVPGLQPGRPGYSFGSYNDAQDETSLQVTSVAITLNVATVGLKFVTGSSGPIPVVGQLITIVGTQTNAGIFNVTNATVVSVSGFNTGDNSVGTVTFNLTGSNVVTTPDNGAAKLPTAEISVPLLAATKGQQFCVSGYSAAAVSNGRSITWAIEFPVAPASIAYQLEGAIRDVDSEYAKIDSGNLPGGETRFVTVPYTVRFLRINVTAVSDTAGSPPVTPFCVGKILI
jgi:hypothetical protein